MDEACAETVAVPASTSACSNAQQHAEPWDPDYHRKRLRTAAACGACVRLAVLASVSYVFVHTVPLTSHEPRQVAFFAGAHVVLAALVVCLRRCAASSHDGSGFWVKATEDIAVDLLLWVFGFRVSQAGPPALSELVWCVMAIMLCVFIYVVYRDSDDRHQYQALGEVRCDDADDPGDSKAVEQVKSTDEMV